MHRDFLKVVDVRAVDVGYFYVKFTTGRSRSTDGGNAIATDMFPAIAPMVDADAAALARGQKNATGTMVEIQGVRYYVGKDVDKFERGTEPREVSEDYCATPKYLALLRGALARIAAAEGVGAGGKLVIEYLVVGLPLNTYAKYKTHLVDVIRGEHPIGDDAGRFSVEVRDVLVLTQPQGALYDAGYAHGGNLEGLTLIVDVGGGTLDFLLGSPKKCAFGRSGAYPKAMLACAHAVLSEINPSWKDNSGVVKRVDVAIREQHETVLLDGVAYKMAEFMPKVDAVLEEAVGKMMGKVGSLADVDRVLCTGGGGRVVYDFLRRKWPKYGAMLQLNEEPVFANVRGFHIRGEVAHFSPRG
jgi:plasmid segregation protein ParM